MTLIERMRAQLKGAMKSRDTVRVQFLRYWIAQFTQGDGTEVSDEAAIKRMRGVLKESKAGPTSFSPEELDLIREWVPATLSTEQIRDALTPIVDQIRAAPKEGMAMGLAMKHLAGQPVESDDVKVVIAGLRS
jgi:hypothetical protein